MTRLFAWARQGTLIKARQGTLIKARQGTLFIARQGTTALEYALVFPAFIVFVFGLVSVYSLLSSRRAMDFGVERALRYMAVNAGGSTTAVSNAYFNAAAIVSGDVGASSAHSSVSLSQTSWAVGDTVTITASYTWTAPANYTQTTSPLFVPLTLTATGAVRIMH